LIEIKQRCNVNITKQKTEKNGRLGQVLGVQSLGVHSIESNFFEDKYAGDHYNWRCFRLILGCTM